MGGQMGLYGISVLGLSLSEIRVGWSRPIGQD